MVPAPIRDASPGDAEKLKALFLTSALSNERERALLLANPHLLELAPSTPGRRTRVYAGDDSSLIGFVSYAPISPAVVELGDLFVDPAHARRGVGSALVLDVMELAGRDGARRIELTANVEAVGFYENLGFCIDGWAETSLGPAPHMYFELEPPREPR